MQANDANDSSIEPRQLQAWNAIWEILLSPERLRLAEQASEAEEGEEARTR